MRKKSLPCEFFEYEDSLLLDAADQRLVRKAKAGDLFALRNLGSEYIWGENGFPRSEERARHWYLVAAKFGHEEAQWDVSTMLIHGEGGPKDVGAGLNFLEKLIRKKRYSLYAEQAAKWLIYWFEGDDELINFLNAILRRQKRFYRAWKRQTARTSRLYRRRFISGQWLHKCCRRRSASSYCCRNLLRQRFLQVLRKG